MDEQQMGLIRQFQTSADDPAGQERAATAKAEAALAPLEAKARVLREQQRAAHRAEGLRAAADFYDQLLADMGDDVHGDPRYWTAVRDIALGLRRRAHDETQPTAGVQPTPHADRRDAFARVIYEHWNPDTLWQDARPDDVIGYRVDAEVAIKAADTVAGTLYAPPLRADVYLEVADRLSFYTELEHVQAAGVTALAGKVREWGTTLRTAEAGDDEGDEGDELVCVDQCGSCDACGMEPFGTPAEGWRNAARFLRRTARESADRQGALHGARLIEAELRRLAGPAS